MTVISPLLGAFLSSLGFSPSLATSGHFSFKRDPCPQVFSFIGRGMFHSPCPCRCTLPSLPNSLFLA